MAGVLAVALVGMLGLVGVWAEGVLGAGSPTARLASASSSAGRGVLPAGVHVVRELPGLSSADSDTYLLSNGSREARVYAHAVNYRTAAGGWVPIEDQLRQAAGGSFSPASSPVTNQPAGLAFIG